MESAEYNYYKKKTVTELQNSKSDKYIAYFVKNFHLKNAITSQELMKLLQKYDRETDIKTPLKVIFKKNNLLSFKEVSGRIEQKQL